MLILTVSIVYRKRKGLSVTPIVNGILTMMIIYASVIFAFFYSQNADLREQVSKYGNTIKNSDQAYAEREIEVEQEIKDIKNSEAYFNDQLKLKSTYFNEVSSYALNQHNTWKEFIADKNFEAPYNYEYQRLVDMENEKTKAFYGFLADKNIFETKYHGETYIENICDNIFHYSNFNYDEQNYDDIENINKSISYDFFKGGNYDVIKDLAESNMLYEYIKNASRSSSQIMEIWTNVKTLVFDKIKKEDLFGESDTETLTTLTNLIKSYQLITNLPNHTDLFEKYDFEDDELKEKLSSLYNTTTFEDIDVGYIQDDFYWYFGFWDRRYKEGNSEVVHNILKEIQQHYNN